MAGKKTVFYCSECGYESSKWIGKCPECNSWNTFVEEVVSKTSRSPGSTPSNVSVKKLSEIKASDTNRVSTGLSELDRVLGGGIVQGSLVLVGGDPGIGKSTLLLQLSKTLTDNNLNVLYVSGEESYSQIKLRSERLGDFNDNLSLFCETNLNDIENIITSKKPNTVIIDSIQTITSDDIASAPGSVSQIREATNRLMNIGKNNNITIFIVGHVTKQGDVAGPRILEHMVDTVLYFEGDGHREYRILRAVKNRFGSTNEIGVFRMVTEGLVEIISPSEFLFEAKNESLPGSVITCTIEGTRPVLLELQALVCRSNYAMPLRTTNGIDYKRVNMLVAVIDKRLNIDMSRQDVYMNITGGIKVDEPAVDLSIIISCLSSYKNKQVDNSTISFGEVGLSGEIRGVNLSDLRVKEGIRLGYTKFIVPKANKKEIDKVERSSNIKIIYIENVSEINDVYF